MTGTCLLCGESIDGSVPDHLRACPVRAKLEAEREVVLPFEGSR